MEEIEEIVKRIDFSWEQGFLSPQDYVAKREQLQQEIEALRPVDYDALIEAADLLENFASYWESCENVDAPLEARKQLLNKIVERVFVYDDTVVGIALHGDYGVVLDTTAKTPNEILKGLQKEIKKGAGNDEIACTQDGSDGSRSLTCIISWTVTFLPKHIAKSYFTTNMPIGRLEKSYHLSI